MCITLLQTPFLANQTILFLFGRRYHLICECHTFNKAVLIYKQFVMIKIDIRNQTKIIDWEISKQRYLTQSSDTYLHFARLTDSHGSNFRTQPIKLAGKYDRVDTCALYFLFVANVFRNIMKYRKTAV